MRTILIALVVAAGIGIAPSATAQSDYPPEVGPPMRLWTRCVTQGINNARPFDLPDQVVPAVMASCMPFQRRMEDAFRSSSGVLGVSDAAAVVDQVRGTAHTLYLRRHTPNPAALTQAGVVCHVQPGAEPYPVNCPQWHPTGHDGRIETFINPATVRWASTTVFTASLRWVSHMPGDGPRTLDLLQRLDCVRRTVTDLSYLSYNDTGQIIESRAIADGQVPSRPVEPDTPSAAILDKYCIR